MAYNAGRRLSPEYASKLGHLDLIDDPLVREIVRELEEATPLEKESSTSLLEWKPLPSEEEPFDDVVVVDGSLKVISSRGLPTKRAAYVKAVVVKYDGSLFWSRRRAQELLRPRMMGEFLRRSSSVHAAFFPLQGFHVRSLRGESLYHSLRKLVRTFFERGKSGPEMYETLKWLLFRKYRKKKEKTPEFACPHCLETSDGLFFDREGDTDFCTRCGAEVFLTDVLGLHLEILRDDAAPDAFASAYMSLAETLLLFTVVRLYWEHYPQNKVSNVLFVKDGPLYLGVQYRSLVRRIRDFLAYSAEVERPVHILGQEKSGQFVDHLLTIRPSIPLESFAVPDQEYIRKEVQQRKDDQTTYGQNSLYGGKVFLRTRDGDVFVVSVGFRNFPRRAKKYSPRESDFIGLKRVLSAIERLRDYRYESALTVISQANKLASLSGYPSTKILELVLRQSLSR